MAATEEALKSEARSDHAPAINHEAASRPDAGMKSVFRSGFTSEPYSPAVRKSYRIGPAEEFQPAAINTGHFPDDTSAEIYTGRRFIWSRMS